MKTNSISSTNFASSRVNVLRHAKGNCERTYFYNEVLEMLRVFKVPAVISNKGFEISAATDAFMEKMTEAGIKFDKVI